MKDIKRFINEAKSGTIDQFFDVISKLFMNPDFDEFWKTKIKSHFKRNKSIFKAMASSTGRTPTLFSKAA